MNKTTSPLKLEMKSPVVGDLQDALELLLERSVLLSSGMQQSSAHSIANRLFLQPQPLKGGIRMEEIQR